MLPEFSADVVDETSCLIVNYATPDYSSCDVHNQNGHEEDSMGLLESSRSSIHQSYQVPWNKSLVFLLGVFLVNSDSSILLAIFRQIASDFSALSSASWIVNSYIIGMLVAQPVYGKLSDIYGRKPLLLIAYCCCIAGAVLAGLGFSFYGVLLGRALAGVGNAGIAVLISTLIVDLVPMRDVAVCRGLVYAVNQTGRALGPPLGGVISDNANWRWGLVYHVPLLILSLIFIWWKISFLSPHENENNHNRQAGSPPSKIQRIDFSGAISLGLANCSLLLFLDQVPRTPNALSSSRTLIPAGTWITFSVVFIAVEGLWAREPILPLSLIVKRDVISSYAIQFFQTVAQMALYTSVPLYFRITQGDSSTSIAARLLFITLGTFTGGLISAFIIKRTGLYRLVIWISIVLSNAGFLAVFLRWRGSTSWLECLYGFPIGFGFGVSLSAAFIGLTARLECSQVAVATSGFYLSMNLGSLFGVGVASLLIQTFVQKTLLEKLKDLPNRRKIVHDVTSNLQNIDRLPSEIKELVVGAYSASLVNVWCFALVCGCLALMASFMMREAESKEQKVVIPNNSAPPYFAVRRRSFGSIN